MTTGPVSVSIGFQRKPEETTGQDSEVGAVPHLAISLGRALKAIFFRPIGRILIRLDINECKQRLLEYNIRHYFLDACLITNYNQPTVVGIMGKTVWVILPFTPDYICLLDRDDSPRNLARKLYRQQSLRY